MGNDTAIAFSDSEDLIYQAEYEGYTTRGVGSLYGLRLNCRPEVTMLELV